MGPPLIAVAGLVAGPFYLRNVATTGTPIPMTRELQPMKHFEARMEYRPRKLADYVTVPWSCGRYPYITVLSEGGGRAADPGRRARELGGRADQGDAGAVGRDGLEHAAGLDVGIGRGLGVAPHRCGRDPHLGELLDHLTDPIGQARDRARLQRGRDESSPTTRRAGGRPDEGRIREPARRAGLARGDVSLEVARVAVRGPVHHHEHVALADLLSVQLHVLGGDPGQAVHRRLQAQQLLHQRRNALRRLAHELEEVGPLLQD